MVNAGAALVAGGALAVRLFATASAFSAVDLPPAQPVAAFEAAFNAWDVEASAQLFSDDAVVIQPRVGGLPEIYVGQPQVRWWLSGMAAQHVHLAPSSSPRFDGDTVRWSEDLSVDVFRELGMDAVPVESDVVLTQDGHIQSLRIALTPQAARAIQAAPGVTARL